MRLFEAIRRRKATVASVATVSALAIGVTTMAFVYEGVTTADVELNDGGVWVTKPSALLIGHLNYPAQVLDGGLKTSSSDFDILQNAETVLSVDTATSTLTSIDPVTVSLGNPVALPPQSSVALGGQTVSVLDRETGMLWSSPANAIANFLPDPESPLYELGSGAAATVDVDGGVHAISLSKSQMITIPAGSLDAAGAAASATDDPAGGDAPAGISTSDLPDIEKNAQLTLVTVGDDAVLFDATDGSVLLPGGQKVTVEGAAGGVVQANGPASGSVLIASATELITQPLDGGEATRTAAGKPGTPAPPVFVKGCAYAAWSGSNATLRDCAGTENDLSTTIDGLAESAKPVFRVNRDVVVLNDLTTGAVWLVNQDMKKVDNWDDIVPPPDETQTEEDDDTTQEELEVTLPERSEQNTPPTAEDDQFGVRAGRTVILPVLDNDSDPDGDVLTATVDSDPGAIGVVQPILNGVALQIVVDPEATGTSSFTYTADDGRGGTDQATVSLTVKAPGTNEPPVQKIKKTQLAELGATVTYKALPEWSDPDGDDLFLRSATASGSNQVQFTPDGTLTFTALDLDPGRKDVTVVVSDGTADTQGTVTFDVRDQGTLAPITNSDRAVTKVGKPVTVSPLLNDYSPSGAPLRLAKINEVPGATIAPDYATGTFTFTASAPGDYYVDYLVTDGPKSAAGLVRITVRADGSGDEPPVAVRDVALLPKGRDTLVNVLANDSDVNGDILAVQSVSVPENLGVSVEVLEHETLRVSDRPGITEPVTFTYTVTNGSKTSTGEVFVVPIPAPERLQPPVAVDDAVTVRAGDVAGIDVLKNDYHPNGDVISLSPTLIDPLLDPADGDIFVAQNQLRFKASADIATQKTVYATYEVVDSQGQKDAGYVTITILPADAGTNSPPRPKDVTIRALQGTTVRIPIPLNGIDPDGDSVQLIGQSTAPQKGRIADVGESWLVYEAYPDSTGTDTFTYTVRDRLGAEASASVLVGIVPSGSANQRPYAVKDTVSVRPGRTVAVDVLANDTDPDGDPIAIREKGLELPDGVEATVAGGRVVVDAPETPGDYTIQYTIVDQYGATAVGALLVTVSPIAPLATPIARDDTVATADAVDRTTTDVDVRENDDDPDGTIDELTVSSADATATVLGNQKLRIELLPTSQIVTYTVTDQDGQDASAFVFVPGLDDLHPTLKPGTKPIVVNSGETISVPLSDYVLVADGKAPRITEASKVTAAHANGASLVADASTMSYTSAEGYYGPDALSFEVTDGQGPDDPLGKKSTLVIPITVVSLTNISPTFLGSSVDVAPGGDPVQLNLRTVSRDPDEGDLEKLQYSVKGSTPAGISAGIDGQTLTVSAAGSAAKGPSTVEIEVTDGQSEPGSGTITVNVLTSTRPLPSATDDVVDRADQGKSVGVDVLSNDYNPYPEDPLTILSADVETGDGTASVDGQQVVVTPAADFVGTMVVRYRIADTTGDPERQADGRVRLTVQGKPDVIGTPYVTSIQDQTVVLSWSPPINNGAEITTYTVSSPQGFSQQCQSTTCTLSGLTNNVEYTFTVTATNAVGTSDPSPSSGPARPDARPDQPAPPTLVFGDKSLTVNWVAPPTHGSPVETYNLEISPAPDRGAAQRYGVSGTSLVWDGLANGTAYQVRVQAVNRAPDPSDFSGWSATEIPAGKPEAPSAPTTTPSQPVGSQAQIAVSWVAPAANGDAVAYYTLNTLQNDVVINTVSNIPGTTTNATVAVSTDDYTFQVSAHNKAGDSEFSPKSSPRRGAVAPSAPTGVSATATGANGTVNLAFTPGAGNGNRPEELGYQYRVNQTGAIGSIPAGGGAVGGLNNGTEYTFDVWAISTVEGVSPGAATTSNPAVPFGPPNAPGVSASANGLTVNLSWSAPASNGRDFSVEVNINGEGWKPAANSGSASRDADYSTQVCIQARTNDSEGKTSDVSRACDTTKDRPNPKVFVSRGSPCSSADEGSANVRDCYRLYITTEDFTGSGAVTCRWTSSQYSESIPRNGGDETLWWSQDTPGNPTYSLEGNASRITCDGVQAQARR
ncbi:Ig-like domain-containing protein [Herbiconiux sp. P16]|uniref:Ig-like domain-containing protein n=1 Tax=Herbiconiux wuyangfengii TaxID=3342794 RepID=UPI0035B9ADC6